jgi:hypothetical protein
MWFLHVKWQTWRISDTRPKSNGYEYEFLPVVCVHVQIFTHNLFTSERIITLPESDPLSSLLLHHYSHNISDVTTKFTVQWYYSYNNYWKIYRNNIFNRCYSATTVI